MTAICNNLKKIHTQTNKMLSRDEIMAMARYEYSRQLSIYTRAQLSRGKVTKHAH
jgi:hypothetical protein